MSQFHPAYCLPPICSPALYPAPGTIKRISQPEYSIRATEYSFRATPLQQLGTFEGPSLA